MTDALPLAPWSGVSAGRAHPAHPRRSPDDHGGPPPRDGRPSLYHV